MKVLRRSGKCAHRSKAHRLHIHGERSFVDDVLSRLVEGKRTFGKLLVAISTKPISLTIMENVRALLLQADIISIRITPTSGVSGLASSSGESSSSWWPSLRTHRWRTRTRALREPHRSHELCSARVLPPQQPRVAISPWSCPD